MSHIRNFTIVRTVADPDGFFPVEAIPISGDPIPLLLSESALLDIAQFHADLRQTRGHPKRSSGKTTKSKAK